jgi:hypothetical protein
VCVCAFSLVSDGALWHVRFSDFWALSIACNSENISTIQKRTLFPSSE